MMELSYDILHISSKHVHFLSPLVAFCRLESPSVAFFSFLLIACYHLLSYCSNCAYSKKDNLTDQKLFLNGSSTTAAVTSKNKGIASISKLHCFTI